MISNKNQTGLKFPWLQIVLLNYQCLNFSPSLDLSTEFQPKSHRQTSPPGCPIGSHTEHIHCPLLFLWNQLVLHCSVFLWISPPPSSLLFKFGSMILSSPLPQTLSIQPSNFIGYISVFPTNSILIQHSKMPVWWPARLKIYQYLKGKTESLQHGI